MATTPDLRALAEWLGAKPYYHDVLGQCITLPESDDKHAIFWLLTPDGCNWVKSRLVEKGYGVGSICSRNQSGRFFCCVTITNRTADMYVEHAPTEPAAVIAAADEARKGEVKG